MTVTTDLKAFVETAAKAYYSMIVFDQTANRWTPEFGDFDKATVDDEADDYVQHGTKRKHIKVVKLPDAKQATIYQYVLKLNGALEVASAKPSVDLDVEIEIAAPRKPPTASPTFEAIIKSTVFKDAAKKIGFKVVSVQGKSAAKMPVVGGANAAGFALVSSAKITNAQLVSKANAMQKAMTSIHKDLKVAHSGVVVNGILNAILTIGYTIDNANKAMQTALSQHVLKTFAVKKNDKTMKVVGNPSADATPLATDKSEPDRKKCIFALQKIYDDLCVNLDLGKVLITSNRIVKIQDFTALASFLNVTVKAIKPLKPIKPSEASEYAVQDMFELARKYVAAAKKIVTKVKLKGRYSLEELAGYLIDAGDLIRLAAAASIDDQRAVTSLYRDLSGDVKRDLKRPALDYLLKVR